MDARTKPPLGNGPLPFVESIFKDLSFDPNGLAIRYRIFRSRHEKPVEVVMDPEHRFGEPRLPSTSGTRSRSKGEVERCPARLARSQRNHIGIALRAFIRLEWHRFQTGTSWFEAKWNIIRDAVRADLNDPK